MSGTTKKKGNNKKVSHHDATYMQLLRSSRMTLAQIAKKTGYAIQTVHRYTVNDSVPVPDKGDMVFVARVLLFRTMLDAFQDTGENAREFSITIAKYTDTLKALEEIKKEVPLHDKVELIEWILDLLSHTTEEPTAFLRTLYEDTRKKYLGEE